MTLCRRGRSVFSRVLVRGLVTMSLIGRHSRPGVASEADSTFWQVRSCSNQPQRLEARVALAGDDDVVVQRDAERAGGLDDLLRHLDIGARGAGIAGGMIVHEATQPLITLVSLNF